MHLFSERLLLVVCMLPWWQWNMQCTRGVATVVVNLVMVTAVVETNQHKLKHSSLKLFWGRIYSYVITEWYSFLLPAFLDMSLLCPEGMCMNRTQVPCEVPSPPNPTTCQGWPNHQGLRPLFFSNSDVGSFTSNKNKSVKVLWDGPMIFHPYLRRLESLTIANVITKAALSSQLSKDPECWSGWGLDLWPPAQQTGLLPPELTRRLLQW